MIVTRWNTSGGSDQSWLFYVDTSTMKLNFSYRDSNGSTYRNNQDTGVVISLNQWHHVAVAREGSNFRYFVNGQLSSTVSDSNTVNNGSTTLRVGQYHAGSTIRNYDGYIADLRIVKGTAVRTSAFTPPTSPLANISGTSLLTCSTQPNVFDASGRTRVSLGSGIKSSTSSTKYAPSNIQIDASSGQGQIYPIGKTTFDDITGDLTFETWVKLDSSAQAYATLFYYADASNTGNPHITLRFGDSGFGYHLQFNVYNSGASNVYSVNLTQSDFTSSFRHVALVRTNGTWRIFVDGTQRNFNSGADPSTFPTESYTQSGTLADIDTAKFGSSNFDGNLEDIRFTPGLSRYPFIPFSETLTSTGVSGTSLLACHAGTIVDGTDTHTITSNGNVAVSDKRPHPGMKSVSFDGTGDYLSLSDDASLQMGSGDFTIEAWVYVNAHKDLNYIYSYSYPYQFTIDSNGHLESNFNDTDNFSTYITIQGSDAIPTSTWTHVAVVRNGNTFTQFVNGAQDGTTTSSATLAIPSTYDPRIGDWGAGSYSFNGYISNFRVVKGTAVYSNSFTPPTAELTA